MEAIAAWAKLQFPSGFKSQSKFVMEPRLVRLSYLVKEKMVETLWQWFSAVQMVLYTLYI